MKTRMKAKNAIETGTSINAYLRRYFAYEKSTGTIKRVVLNGAILKPSWTKKR